MLLIETVSLPRSGSVYPVVLLLFGVALQALDQKTLASHVLGLRESHSSKNGGRNVSEDGLGCVLQAPALGGVGHDEGDPGAYISFDWFNGRHVGKVTYLLVVWLVLGLPSANFISSALP